jgi:hypothetical protein
MLRNRAPAFNPYCPLDKRYMHSLRDLERGFSKYQESVVLSRTLRHGYGSDYVCHLCARVFERRGPPAELGPEGGERVVWPRVLVYNVFNVSEKLGIITRAAPSQRLGGGRPVRSLNYGLNAIPEH